MGALIVALGYGINRAPAPWMPLLGLLLPLAVFLLALLAGRVIAAVGALLAVVMLLPGLATAVEDGALPTTVHLLAVAALCLLAGTLPGLIAGARRLRERLESRLRLDLPAVSAVTDATARQMEELAVQAEIARTIGASLELRDTLEAILTSTRRLIAFDMAEITLWDAAQQALVSRGSLDAETYHAEVGQTYRLNEGYSGWLARNRRPLLITDIPTCQEVRPKLDRPDSPFRSYLGIPLENKGEFVGTLELISRQPAAFSQHDLELLQAIGQQAAVAIGNARFYQEAQRRAAEMTSLGRVSAMVTSTLDLQKVLDAIAGAVLEVVGCQQSAIFVLDERSGLLRLAAARGMSETYLAESQALPIELGGRTHVAATGEPLIVEDIATATASFRQLAQIAEMEGFRAFADLPLRVGPRVIGLLSVLFAQPRQFTPLERELLTAFADQASVAIENARLYARLDREFHRRGTALAALQRVSRELSTTFDQEHILRLVLEEAARVGGVTHAAILLREPETTEWGVALCSGYLEEEQAALRRSLQEANSPLEIVAREGRSLRLRTFLGRPSPAIPPSALLVPIWYGETPTGIILLESPHPQAFDDEAQEFIEGLAHQAAIAIGNARRYQEQLERSELLRMQAEQRGHILKVSQAIRSDQPLEEVLQEIAYAVQESVGFNLVLISVLEGDPPVLRRVAGAGMPLSVLERMKRTPQPWRAMEVVVQEEFRISHSYYVPAEEQARWRGVLDVYETEAVEPRQAPDRWHPHDILIVPLLGPGGEIRGTLSVDEPADGRVPDRAKLEALEVFAAQAAVAVENARLVEALQRRLELLTFFDELNRSVTSKLDLDAVLRAVVEATTHIVRCDGSLLFLEDEESGRYVPRAAFGYNLESLSTMAFAQGEGLVGSVAASGMPLAVTDLEQEAQGQPHYSPRGSTALIPLTIGDKVAGVLTADRVAVEPFSPADVATLTALADQVAVAVQNARLFDESVQRQRELAVLLEASSAISFTLDLQWMLQALGDRLLATSGAECCLISEWDPENNQVRVLWEVGQITTPRLGVAYSPAERPLVTEVLMSQEPLIHPTGLWPGQEEGQTLLLAMVARGRTMGLVELERRGTREGFTSRQIYLAQVVANQAAIALQNARLFEETRRFSEELEDRVEERTKELAQALMDLTAERDRVETLYRIASELSASLDLDHLLNRTLELMGQAVGAEEGAILLRDPQTDRLIYRAALGVVSPLPPGGRPVRLRHGQGLAWWVIEHGETARLEDLHNDNRWMPSDRSEDSRRACLAVPVGTVGEIQGAVMLYHSNPGHFTVEHQRLVEAAASQIANAISNAALYNLIREQAEQLGAMLKQQRVEAAKSQAILEDVADGVLVSDTHGRVILFNAAAERVLDISRREVLGRSMREMLGLYGAAGRAWLEAVEDWAAHPGDLTPGDFVAERVQVGPRIVSVHVSPVVMGKEFLGTVSIFRDITAEVEADRAKSEFVSTVSHELRTPMTSIKGYADLLLMGAVGEMSEQQRHFVTVIRNNANRLTSLVNDLLDISRIETGRVELNQRAVSMTDLVEQVVATLQGRARERNLELTSSLDKGLPAVWGDADRLTQILTNLTGNAIQYTPPGGRVSISARATEDMLEVAVSDTGIGISREDQAKIFDRFFRADDPLVQETSGTGLGLAITASLVHMHGGEIWVESELGEGSTFYFTIPLARRVGAGPPPSGAHILVVEDEVEVANLLRLHLQSEGHQVDIAATGDEAVRKARQEEPDLITLDIRLPDVDGFTVLRALKQDTATAHIPVVIVSALPDEGEGLRMGAAGYVAKPIEEEALLRAVKQVLDGRGMILAVDDDNDTLVMMREVLRRHGYNVRTTRRGQRAVVLAQEVRPALILLDLRLEDIDGYEVLRQLKTHPLTRDIPIVVITGSVSQKDLEEERVLSLGAQRFLTKPFAVEDLIQEIDSVLGYVGAVAGE